MLVEIGTVLGPHGLRGEVRVRLHFSASELLFERDSVWVGGEEKQIEGARGTGKGVLLKLEGVTDRDQAAGLAGSVLAVPRQELPPLDEGEFYLCDLVGAEVFTPTGSIGRVVEVRIHTSVDSIVIRLSDGRLAEQILNGPWLESVESGRIVLASTDGLIE